jgi:large subunit ribosomal protein L9
MRVVFLEDVTGVAQGGDVKEVKAGFARNYLIPKRLATPITKDALQRVERLKKEAEATRTKTLADMKDLREALDGAQLNVEMRAGASGRLYGSVTNAMVAEGLAKIAEREIDRRTISIPESIRKVGLFDLRIRLHAEVEADIKLLVHPAGTDPVEFLESFEAAREAEKEAGESSDGDVAVAQVEATEIETDTPAEDTAAVDEEPDDTVAEQEASKAVAEAPHQDVSVAEEEAPEAEEQPDEAVAEQEAPKIVAEAPPEDVSVAEEEKADEDGETREGA